MSETPTFAECYNSLDVLPLSHEIWQKWCDRKIRFGGEIFTVLDTMINAIRRIRRFAWPSYRIRDQWELDVERDAILERGFADIRFLISVGVSVDQRGRGGHTPLHAAVRFGMATCVSLLLEAHPSLDDDVAADTDGLGYTALNIACTITGADRLSIVKQLILAGAKATIVDATTESLVYLIAAGADAPLRVFCDYAKAGKSDALRFLIAEYGISELQKPILNGLSLVDSEDTAVSGWLRMIVSRWPLEFASLFKSQRDEINKTRDELATAMRLRTMPMIAELSIAFRHLPALVTLYIVDAVSDWHPQYRLLTMHYKWRIITLTKHFRSK